MSVDWDLAFASLLEQEAPSIDSDAARIALEPTLWLLERGNDAIALTQTGALNRALVREVAERWPDWWDADLFGPPNREADVTLLSELHRLLRKTRLLRRSGPQIKTTKRGRALHADPAALLEALTAELLDGDDFDAACARLVAPLLIAGVTADYSDALAERILLEVVADGWHAEDEPVDVRDVSWAIASFLRPAEAIGLLERAGKVRSPPGEFVLRGVGRATLLAAMRASDHSPTNGL